MNRLRIFEHVGESEFNLILDIKTDLIKENQNHNEDLLREHLFALKIILDNNSIAFSEGTDGIIMINGDIVYRLSNFDNMYLDCVESDYLRTFNEWYSNNIELE